MSNYFLVYEYVIPAIYLGGVYLTGIGIDYLFILFGWDWYLVMSYVRD